MLLLVWAKSQNMPKIDANFDYIQIDAPRLDETCEAYFKWKDLNTYVSRVSTRGINMPDVISEPIGCWCLDLLWSRGSGITGDGYNPRTHQRVEFKATSNFAEDLSSFGPKCEFDDLVFLRFNLEDNKVYIYDLHLDSEDFGKYPANKIQTIEDQKKQGRRPHVSLCKLFVKQPNGMERKPDIIFDIRRQRIVEDNR